MKNGFRQVLISTFFHGIPVHAGHTRQGTRHGCTSSHSHRSHSCHACQCCNRLQERMQGIAMFAFVHQVVNSNAPSTFLFPTLIPSGAGEAGVMLAFQAAVRRRIREQWTWPMVGHCDTILKRVQQGRDTMPYVNSHPPTTAQ